MNRLRCVLRDARAPLGWPAPEPAWRSRLAVGGLVLLGALALSCGGTTPEERRPPSAPPVVQTPPPPTVPPPIPTPEPAPPAGAPTEIVRQGSLAGPRAVLTELHRLFTTAAARPLDVIHYGDSHSAAAGLADELRRGASLTGKVSPGYVVRGLPILWDAKVDRTGKWTRQNWLATRDTGSFGPMGLAYVTRQAGAELSLELGPFGKMRFPEELLAAPAAARGVPTRGIEVTAYYWNRPELLPFQLQAGGRTLARVQPPKVADPERTLGWASVTLPDGVASVKLVVGAPGKAARELRVFGFRVRYPDSDVEWDTLGVGGTTVLHPLQRRDETLTQYLVHRNPELFLVWFGTNSVLEPKLDVEAYGRKYGDFLRLLKETVPGAQCLALGPPDLPRREKGCFPKKEPRHPKAKDGKNPPENRLWRVCHPDRLVETKKGKPVYPVPEVKTPKDWEAYKERCTYHTHPNVTRLNDAQRQAALAQGCAYFDVFEYMGGNESMFRWACEEDPQLGMFDFVHLLQPGYRKVAQGVLEAIRAK